MGCSPHQIAGLWQRLVRHELSKQRLDAFLNHRAVIRLRKFDDVQLTTAARRAMGANDNGHLLLDEWLRAARLGRVYNRGESSEPNQGLTREQQEARAQWERDRAERKRNQAQWERERESQPDPSDFQLRANSRRLHGPRKHGEPR